MSDLFHKDYEDFYTKPAKMGDRYVITVPANLIELKRIKPEINYRVIMIPLDISSQDIQNESSFQKDSRKSQKVKK
jgi:hypothetical protein